ncbi:MAG: hypothetical protein K2X87_18980 [Gemmataceae bacterium]|nr:hypothetical protein [Gemmataceae bacterium]
MTRFTPTLTALEARDCPASAILAGRSLYITTSSGADIVRVRDDGRGQVTAEVRGADGTVTAAGAADRVFIHLRGRYDTLYYAVTGPVTRRAEVVVDLGRGGSPRASFDLPPDPGTGRLGIDLRGEARQGRVDAWVGRGGMGGVTITDRTESGGVKIHAARADHVSGPALPPPAGPGVARP